MSEDLHNTLILWHHNPSAKEVIYQTYLNEYHPVVLTPITIKRFNCLVLSHIRSIIPPDLGTHAPRRIESTTHSTILTERPNWYASCQL